MSFNSNLRMKGARPKGRKKEGPGHVQSALQHHNHRNHFIFILARCYDNLYFLTCFAMVNTGNPMVNTGNYWRKVIKCAFPAESDYAAPIVTFAKNLAPCHLAERPS